MAGSKPHLMLLNNSEYNQGYMACHLLTFCSTEKYENKNAYIDIKMTLEPLELMDKDKGWDCTLELGVTSKVCYLLLRLTSASDLLLNSLPPSLPPTNFFTPFSFKVCWGLDLSSLGSMVCRDPRNRQAGGALHWYLHHSGAAEQWYRDAESNWGVGSEETLWMSG